MQPEDILREHREKVVCWLSTTILFIVLPFALNNLYKGHLFLAASSLAVVGILVSNATAFRAKRTSPVPVTWLFPAVATFLVLSFKEQGVVAAFWCYPAVIVFYFMLPPREARWVNVLLLSVIVPSAFQVLPPEIAIRIFASLVAVSVCSGIFMHLLSLQHHALQRMAVIDPLTQVHNRLQLDSVLHKSKACFMRYQTPVSLVALDIDHFKSINDTFGHAGGDEVLSGLATLLRRRLRASDMVFRTGGEEFLLLLTNTDERQAAYLAENLRMLVADSSLLEQRQVTISLGVVQLLPAQSVSDWLNEADRRLYYAKSCGRNKVALQASHC